MATMSATTTSHHTVDTTDATVTNVVTLTIADNSTVIVRLTVGARSANSAGAAGYFRCFRVRRQGGTATVTELGAGFLQEGTGTMDATLIASANDAVVQVTGVAAVTIHWGVEVSYYTVTA